MIIQAHLLTNPNEIPRLGWARIEQNKIVEINHTSPPKSSKTIGGPDYLLTPGFIDAHTHFPQFQSIGIDGLELLDWLKTAIYPAESTWENQTHANQQARAAIINHLRAGTLGCAAYLTNHKTGIPALQNTIKSLPMRIIAGRVIMDQNAPANLLSSNFNPEEYLPSESSEPQNNRLEISINPRFAVSCSDTALAFAASLANPKSHRFIQTHLAESIPEINFVHKLFPNDKTYTDLYDRHHLLHNHSLLAHCNHLTDNEWQLLAKRNAVAVHCPTANIFLQSGYFNLDKARQFNIRIALGSDIAAGSDHSMVRVARAMIETAKWRRLTIQPNAYIPTPQEAWHLITRGNAQALNWQNAGTLQPGAPADLLLLKPDIPLDEHYISRLIYNWHDSWIKNIILDGQSINIPPK